MSDKKIKEVLARQISKIELSEEELREIKEETKNFIDKLKKNIKKKKIKADVFVGGSLAKETLIRKKLPDVDIFVRFSKDYDDKKLSILLDKVVQGKRIHGSRDYFQVKKKGVLFEIVPVLKISKPVQARNVTDLSYFHVKYIKDKIKKNKNLGKEIMLAKNFCYAQGCYGAESYISGFSGYALELLVSYYGSFVRFIEAIKDKQQVIIDPSKFYKNKQEVLLELNESKLSSPIIFVDPTFKERNALAALSLKTFEKFKVDCNTFLKNPSSKFFEKKDLNKEFAKYKDLKKIKIKTNRQKGDIAGSKLKKFYLFLINKIKIHYNIRISEFSYNEDKNLGLVYLVLQQKKELIFSGPHITSVENLNRFKKKHKKCFIKKGRSYAREKPKNINLIIKNLDKKTLKAMGITKVELV